MNGIFIYILRTASEKLEWKRPIISTLQNTGSKVRMNKFFSIQANDSSLYWVSLTG